MEVSSTVKKIQQEYSSTIRLVAVPLVHPKRQYSLRAALAALAARDQGKYWEMHDQLFDQWPDFDRAELLTSARTIGLDLDRFEQALNSRKNTETLERNKKLAEDLHVIMTPTFFINGKKYVGELSYREFKSIIEKELNHAKP
jgi:protein-disulfide isomerase